MWVAYLDFMRQQWPDIKSVEEVENRYKEFNTLAPPYKSAFSEWITLKKNVHSGPAAYKRQKISS